MDDDRHGDAGSPAQEPSDAWGRLMALAQAGDQASYRALLIAVTPFIRGLARRGLRDTAESEDAVQDILITLHTLRHTFDPSRPLRPWLAGIIRFRLLDRRRAEGLRGRRLTQLGPEHENVASRGPVADSMAVDAPALRLALEALPAGQRQAIELTKLRELSLKEASVVSGMSIGALKVATHRGIAHLRRLLAGGGDRA